MTPSRRVLVWTVIIGVPLIVLGSLAVWKGPGIYKERQRVSFLREGRAALAKGDYKSASLWALRLHQSDPNGVETSKLLADLHAAQNLPDTMICRLVVAARDQTDMANMLELCRLALEAHRADIVLNALLSVPAEYRKTSPVYHDLAAKFAAVNNQLPEAEAEFAEAARLDPKNANYLFSLNSMRLDSRDPAVAAKAREEMKKLAALPETKAMATGALLAEAMARKNAAAVPVLRSQLLACPDRPMSLEILCLNASPTEAAFLEELKVAQQMCAANPASIGPLGRWLLARGSAKLVIQWLEPLHTAGETGVVLESVLGDGYTSVGDWDSLADLLRDANWRETDPIRQGGLIRALEMKGEPNTATMWNALMRTSRISPVHLLTLSQYAGQWGWKEREEDGYWQVAALGFPLRKEALVRLWKRYSVEHKTRGLLRVCEARLIDDPTSAELKSNVAFLSNLLKVQNARAVKLSGEAAAADPTNSTYAAVHGYSLLLAGKVDASIGAYDDLPEAERQKPNVALYLALAYKQANRLDEAKKYAAFVTGRDILQEELQLATGLNPTLSLASP